MCFLPISTFKVPHYSYFIFAAVSLSNSNVSYGLTHIAGLGPMISEIEFARLDTTRNKIKPHSWLKLRVYRYTGTSRLAATWTSGRRRGRTARRNWKDTTGRVSVGGRHGLAGLQPQDVRTESTPDIKTTERQKNRNSAEVATSKKMTNTFSELFTEPLIIGTSNLYHECSIRCPCRIEWVCCFLHHENLCLMNTLP